MARIKRISFLITYILIYNLNFASSQTVKIGEQVWSSKNLDVVTFRNGDTIHEAKSNEEWKNACDKKQPAWCFYFNDPNNAIYGRLYNWYAVNDIRGLAPTGYHIPTNEEWDMVIDFLGGNRVAGKKMKQTFGWGDYGNGTNESGFSALPSGYRLNDGRFFPILSGSIWWASTEHDSSSSWYRLILWNVDYVYSEYGGKDKGLSVRIIAD